MTNMKEEGVCPIQKLMKTLSSTWVMLILRELMTSSKRFCELEKALVGISTRTLTLKLKYLQEESIVEHADLYYSLTKKGVRLRSILKEMEKVGESF